MALQGAKPTTTRGVAIRLCPQGRDVEGHVPGTDEAFGLVEGYDDELGYFSIKEMEELNRQMGFAAVERDEHFSPKPLSAVRRR